MCFSGSLERPMSKPQHRRAVRVLKLEPAFRAARAVGQIASLDLRPEAGDRRIASAPSVTA